MSKIQNATLIDGYYQFKCPHCLMPVEVKKNQLNCCKIFRCGIIKKTFKQMNPHTPKPECDRLADNDLIYGCGKPFRFVLEKMIVEECGYI